MYPLAILVIITSKVSDYIVQGSPRVETEQSIIKRLLGDGDDQIYDWRIRPQGTQTGDGPGASHIFEQCLDESGVVAHYTRQEIIFVVKNASPVMVTVNMYLRTISKVDDVNMEYSLHFTFREEWIDERLRFNDSRLKYVNLSPGQQIWMPDTFFQNEKDGKKHEIDTPNVLLRIYNDTGKILYSVRFTLTLTLSCPMRLHTYPMDIQSCVVEFASYAYTTDDIDYKWVDISQKSPVQIKTGLRQSLPSFKLSAADTGICTSKTNTGAYSCLRLTLVLKREFSYYMLQLYIPSFMLVAVSWVSFWLDKDSVPARVTLGVTTLLTMTTQASGINAKLPPVSYTKAIDVWIGVCLAFIFGALLEFALINYAARRDMIENQRSRASKQRKGTTYGNNPLLHDDNPFQPTPLIGSGGAADVELQGLMAMSDMREDRHSLLNTQPAFPHNAPHNQNWYPPHSGLAMKPSTRRHISEPRRSIRNGGAIFAKLWTTHYRNTAKRIDVLARILFPVTFVLFNVCYWVIYLRPYLQLEDKLSDYT